MEKMKGEPKYEISAPYTQPNMTSPELLVRLATSPAEIAAVRALIVEYLDSLNLSLDFQNVEGELRRFPGDYAAPSGCLVLATYGEQSAGCGAIRALDKPYFCELKRFFVRPALRGLGIGGLLVDTALYFAIGTGYKVAVLDTVADRMEAAIQLYLRKGFYKIEPYYHNPTPSVIFLQRDLEAPFNDEPKTQTQPGRRARCPLT